MNKERNQLNLDEFIQVVNNVVFTCEGRYLSDVEEQILIGSIQGMTYKEMAKKYFRSERTLSQHTGYHLWRLLTVALGERVRKNNIKAVARRAIERSQLNSINEKPRKKRRNEILFLKTLKLLVDKLLNYKKA